MFCAAFLCLHFGFVILWQKEIITKAARKLLVKFNSGSQLISGHDPFKGFQILKRGRPTMIFFK